MGCGESKPEDVVAAQPRTRLPTTDIKTPSKSSTLAIGSSRETDQGGPMSYTDRNLEDQEDVLKHLQVEDEAFFKTLVEETESKFIHLAPSGAPLGQGEAREREQSYQTFNTTPVRKAQLVFSMPTNAMSMVGPSMDQHSNHISDQKFMKTWSTAFATAYKSMAVKDSGALIEVLPDIVSA